MNFKDRTIRELAKMICGDFELEKTFFYYRTSSRLTEFFQDCDTDYRHDGSTRRDWVADVLKKILSESPPGSHLPPETFASVIRVLMNKEDALHESPERKEALKLLNITLKREGFEAFYAPDDQCYLRHIGTDTVIQNSPDPHRPFTEAELKKREQLANYLNKTSEDELIKEILLPLFRQLGFQRVTVVGHKDKSLEYGKDLWMKFTLPTIHPLYFGLQVKKDKIDAAGVTKSAHANIAEIHNQALMMLGHEIFDPEINKQVLVDHAFIISGGEITKAAQNWLGSKLGPTQRSQIMFMDRDDILNLFIATNLSLPASATLKPNVLDDEDIPF